MKKIWYEYGSVLLTMIVTSMLIGLMLFSAGNENHLPQLNDAIGQVFRI